MTSSPNYSPHLPRERDDGDEEFRREPRDAERWRGVAALVERSVIQMTAVAIVLLFCALTIVGLVVPPTMNYDAALGFHTLASMTRGAAWNHTTTASASNISRDNASFNAAFSPGQYMIPGLFGPLGIKLGSTVLLTCLVFTLSGCTGLWFLYTHLGFSPAVATIATAAVSLSRSVVMPFGVYNGGEVLLFGTFPWVTIAALKVLQHGSGRWIVFPLLAVAAAFLKLSFVLCCASLIVAWVFHQVARQPRWRQAIRPTAEGVVLLILTYSVVYLLYTSRGWTAAEPSWELSRPFINFLLILSSTVSAAVSGMQLADHLYSPAAELRHSFHTPVSVAVLAAAACVSGWIAAKVVIRNWHTEYGRLVMAFAVTSLPMFLYLFSVGGSWYEERHIRPLSLLLWPGVISWIMSQPFGRWRTLLLVCLTGIPAIYGLGAFGNSVHRRQMYAASARTGFTQWDVSPSTLSALHASLAEGERHGTGGLMISANHALSIEVKPPWRFSHHPDMLSRQRRYEGAVPRLVVHIPKPVPQDVAERVCSAFPGMSRWWLMESDDAVLLYAGSAALAHMSEWQRMTDARCASTATPVTSYTQSRRSLAEAGFP